MLSESPMRADGSFQMYLPSLDIVFLLFSSWKHLHIQKQLPLWGLQEFKSKLYEVS